MLLAAVLVRIWPTLAATTPAIDQQYLAKNPYGYRCHSATGVPFPQDV